MPIRVVLQGVDQASILVDNEEKYVRIGRGVIIYVAFLQGSSGGDEGGIDRKDMQGSVIDDAALQHAVDVLLKTKIFTHFSPEKMLTRPQSLEESPYIDILIVPQASLGGKVKKGHTIQFHALVDREAGTTLYNRFCHLMRVARGVDESTVDVNGGPLLTVDAGASSGWLKYDGRVVCGTFGNRQGLVMESSGPFTHTFDL